MTSEKSTDEHIAKSCMFADIYDKSTSIGVFFNSPDTFVRRSLCNFRTISPKTYLSNDDFQAKSLPTKEKDRGTFLLRITKNAEIITTPIEYSGKKPNKGSNIYKSTKTSPAHTLRR